MDRKQITERISVVEEALGRTYKPGQIHNLVRRMADWPQEKLEFVVEHLCETWSTANLPSYIHWKTSSLDWAREEAGNAYDCPRCEGNAFVYVSPALTTNCPTCGATGKVAIKPSNQEELVPQRDSKIFAELQGIIKWSRRSYNTWDAEDPQQALTDMILEAYEKHKVQIKPLAAQLIKEYVEHRENVRVKKKQEVEGQGEGESLSVGEALTGTV